MGIELNALARVCKIFPSIAELPELNPLAHTICRPATKFLRAPGNIGTSSGQLGQTADSMQSIHCALFSCMTDILARELLFLQTRASIPPDRGEPGFTLQHGGD